MGLVARIRSALAARRRRARTQVSRHSREALFPGLFVRRLEERRVLSIGSVIGGGIVTLNLTGGDTITLTSVSATQSQAEGTSNTVVFDNPATQLVINVQDANSYTLTFTDLADNFNPTNGIAINGGDGAEAVTIKDLGDVFGHGNTGALSIALAGGADLVRFQTHAQSFASLSIAAETISQTVALSVSGATTLDAGATNDISLDDAANDFGSVAVTAARDVTLVDGAGDLTLAAISASGSVAVTTGGTLTIDGDISLPTGNLTLNAGATTQNSGHTITAAGLELLGFGPYTLTQSGNDVNTLAANSGGAVRFRDANGLTVGTVLGTSGITTTGDDVTLDADTGALAVSQAIDAGSASVSITADTIDIQAAITGNGGITLQPVTASRTIGLHDPLGDFNLTASELGLLASTGTATIGASGGSGAVSIGGTALLNLNTESYDLTLRGGAVTFTNGIALPNNKTLTFHTGGVTSGAGTDVVIGGSSGKLVLNTSGAVGAPGNPLSMNVDLLEGTSGGDLVLSQVGSVALTANGLSAGANTIQLEGGTLNLGGSDRIADSTSVKVNGATAKLDISGNNETVGGVILAGGSIKGASGVLTSTSDFEIQSGTVSARLGGSVGLNKTTGGTVTLSGDNRYTGATSIAGGTLLVDGSTATSSAVTVHNAGTLGGTGTVGGSVTVHAGGQISGGTDGGVGTLTVGSLAFNGGTYRADLIGTAADQITTAGSVDLANTDRGVFSLNNNGSGISPGTSFVLVDNIGTAALADPPLTNAPEGGAVTVDNQTAYYGYAAGAGGNDFVLQVAGPASYTGTNGSDSFQIQRVGGSLWVLLGGSLLDARPYDSVTAITINAGQADDTLTVDFSGGDPIPIGGITYHGENPASGPGDSLTLQGGSLTSLTYDVNGGQAGRLTINGNRTIDFTGLEPLFVNTTAQTVTVNVDPTDLQTDPITTEFTSVSSTQSRVAFSPPAVAGESLTFNNPTVELIVNGDNSGGSDADDTITFTSLSSGFVASITVDGGAGSDLVNLNTSLTLGGGSGPSAGHLDVSAEAIRLNAAAIHTDGDPAGADNVSLTGAVTLGTDVVIDTDSGAGRDGSILVTGSITGTTARAEDLTLSAGSGTIGVIGPIGATRLGALRANSSSTTTWGGSVTAASVTTDAGGVTRINGGSIDTTGLQTYNDAVILDAAGDSTLLTGANISFAASVRSEVDGQEALTASARTATTFGGPVGDNNQRLASLTLVGGESTAIDGGEVTTSGSQHYADNVDLGADAVLSGTTITFDSDIAGAGRSLLVRGDAVFGDATGDSVADVNTLTVTGATALNANTVTTTSHQDYQSTLTLGQGTTATLSTGGGNLTIRGETRGTASDGAETLTVNLGGGTLTVAAISGLAGGTADAAGLTTLDVSSAGTANFLGAITLTRGVTQSAGSGTTTFQGGGTFGGALNVNANAVVVQTATLNVTGAIALTATAGVRLDAGLNGGSTATIDADSDGNGSGTLTTAAAGTLATTGGTIDIRAADVSLAGTINATGTGRVQLRPSTAAAMGLGSSGPFNLTTAEAALIAAGTLQFGSTSAGPITIDAAFDFTGSVSTLYLAGAGTIGESGSGSLTVTNLAVSAGDSVTLNAAGNEVTNLALRTSSGSVRYADATGVSVSGTELEPGVRGVWTSAGDVELAVNGDLRVGGTVGTAAGTATVSSAGAIFDDNSTADADFDAATLVLTAATGIGTTAGAGGLTIEINGGPAGATRLDLHNSTSGGVNVRDLGGGLTLVDANGSGPALLAGGGEIQAASPLTIRVSQTVTGSTTYTAGNSASPDDDLTVTDGATITLNSSADATLTFQAGDDILLGSAGSAGRITTAGGGTHAAVLDADREGAGVADGDRGSVTQDAASGTSIATDSLTIAAGDGIGSAAQALQISVGFLTTDSSSNNAAQFLTESDGVAVSTLNAGGGDITLAATAGAIADANGAATNITAASFVASAATGIDLDTAVGSLTATTSGAGDITIDEADGASVSNVAASNGNVTVTSAAGDLAIDTTSASGTVTLSAAAGAIADSNGAANNVTAASLVASAATGVGLDTTVGNLTATTSGAGQITIDEADGASVLNVAVANGDATVTSAAGDLAIATVSASGTVTLSATAGAIADANGAANNITAASLVASAATGIDLDTDVANLTATTSGVGHITIDEADGASVSNVAAANGSATVTSATGTLSIAAVSAGGTVTLSATAGAIADANGAATNVTAADLVASAATGVATAGDRLETAVSRLEASGGTGGVFVVNTQSLTLGGIGAMVGVSATGSGIAIAAHGALTVSEAVSSSGGGDIALTTNDAGTAGGLTVNAAVTAQGSGTVTLTADAGTLDLNAAVSSTSGALAIRGDAVTQDANLSTGGTGTVQVTADSGPIVMADFTSATSGDGQISYQASTDVALSLLSTSGDLVVTASSGAITDNTASESANLVTTGTATLSAATGIGISGAGDLDTAIGTLAAANSTSGDIVVQETDSLSIAGPGVQTQGGNGNIDLDVDAGGLTVSAGVTAHGSGTVTLNADAGAIGLNAAVGSSSGGIAIRGVIVSQNGDISTGGTGTLRVTADNGDIVMADGTSTTSDSGRITYEASGSVALGRLTSASGDLVVTASSGAITDNTALESANLATTGTATLTAATGIGASGASDIDTAIGTLVAANTTSGDIVVHEADGLIVGGPGVQAQGGDGSIRIDVDAGGLTIDALVTAQGAGTVMLTSAVQPLRMLPGSQVLATAPITLSADGMQLDGTVRSPAEVRLVAHTPSTAVQLGMNAEAGGGLALTDAELNTVQSPTVRVGYGQGPITFTGEFSAASHFASGFLELRTAGSVTGTAGAVRLAGDLVIRSGGTVDLGTPAHDFHTVAVSTGGAPSAVTLRDAVGGITIGSVDGLAGIATGSAGISVTTQSGDLTISSPIQTAADGSVRLQSTGDIRDSHAAGADVLTGRLWLNAARGVAVAGAPLATQATALEAVVGAAGLFLSNTGDMDIGGVDPSTTGISAAGGAVSLTVNSTVRVNEAVSGQTIAVEAGLIQLASDLTSSGGDIVLTGPVQLSGNDATAAIGSGGGNILFTSSVDNQVGRNNSLALAAGAGRVTFNADLGTTNRLNRLVIANASDVSLPAVRAASIEQQAGSGTTTLNGPLNTSGAAGVVLATQTINVDSSITAANGGITLTNAGTLTIAADLVADLAVVQNGAGPVLLGGNIATANGDVTFAAPVTLTATPTIDTGAGGRNIAFNGPVDAGTDGGQGLRLTAGGGNIVFARPIGSARRLGSVVVVRAGDVDLQSIKAASLEQQAGTGTTTLHAPVDTQGALGVMLNTHTIRVDAPITATGGPITFTNAGTLTIAIGANLRAGGDVLQNGSGPVLLGANVVTANGDVGFAGPVTLLQSVAVNTSSGGKDISLAGTVQGTSAGQENLTLTAGLGDITLANALGTPTRLGDLTITSAHNVTLHAVSAASLSQLAGTGVTTFRGSVDITGAIDVGRTSAISQGIVFEAAGGSIQVTTAGAPAATDPDVRLNGAIALQADVGINAAQGITFLDTIDSQIDRPHVLTIVAGLGGVAFHGDVGNASGGRNVLERIDVRTDGVLRIDNGVLLRTADGAVSNAPPRLTVVEVEPGRPLGTDRTQRLTGTAGGVDPARDNLERGENLILTVQWDGLPAGTPRRVNGGEEVRLFTGEGGTDAWTTVSPGSGSGPIQLVQLAHVYPAPYILRQASQGATNLTAIVTLENDPSIRLFGKPTDGSPAADLSKTSIELDTASATVRTLLPVNPLVAPSAPPAFVPPLQALAAGVQTLPVDVRTTPPPVRQLDEIQLRTESTVENERELTIVKVGPDGKEEEPHQLPEGVLENLKGLFDRFIEEGLPDGRYRIYLREIGFPPRKLIEFHKSGHSIGDPVREPGPGSKPILDAADEEQSPHGVDPDGGVGSGGSGERPNLPPLLPPATGPHAGQEAPATEAPQPENSASSYAAEPTRPACWAPRVAGASLLACAGWSALAARGRWAATLDRALENSEAGRFTLAARWRRRQ